MKGNAAQQWSNTHTRKLMNFLNLALVSILTSALMEQAENEDICVSCMAIHDQRIYQVSLVCRVQKTHLFPLHTFWYVTIGKEQVQIIKFTMGKSHLAALVSGSWCCAFWLTVTLPWLTEILEQNRSIVYVTPVLTVQWQTWRTPINDCNKFNIKQWGTMWTKG